MKLYKSFIKKYITKKNINIQLFIVFILLFIFLYIIFRNIREGFSMDSITSGSSSSTSQYQYLAPPDPSNINTNLNSLTVDEQNAFISKYNTVNDLSGNQSGRPIPMDNNGLQGLSHMATADEIRYYTENGTYPYDDYVTTTILPTLQKIIPNRNAYWMFMSGQFFGIGNEANLNTNAYQVFTGKIADPDTTSS
jgi:hypothetical protein